MLLSNFADIKFIKYTLTKFFLINFDKLSIWVKKVQLYYFILIKTNYLL